MSAKKLFTRQLLFAVVLPTTVLGRLGGHRNVTTITAPRRLRSKVDSGKVSQETKLHVVVGFSDNLVSTSESSQKESLHGLGSFGSRIQTKFKRVNAVAMTITESEWNQLAKDPAVAYIQNDPLSYAYSEEIPWGIPVIEADDTLIPLPNNTTECFKVCVVDSGLMVSHPDIPYSLGDVDVEGESFGLPPGQLWSNPMSSASHGTHVTGTIIAAGGNGIGIAGVIPNKQNICMMHARVFPDELEDGQQTSFINAGAEWCADNGARVINMSLGSTENTNTSEQIFREMFDEGVLVISASGNMGDTSLSYPASYETVMSVAAVDANMTRAIFSQYNEHVDICAPGDSIVSTAPGVRIIDGNQDSYQGEIMAYSGTPNSTIEGELYDCEYAFEECVGATGKVCLIERGNTTFLSKALKCAKGGGIAAIVFNNVEGAFSGTLSVPGATHIPVLAMSREDGLILQNKQLSNAEPVKMDFWYPTYERKSGTSMASPHAAGVAAKIWAARPECTNAQIRRALEDTAIDLGIPGRDNEFGHGLVQAVKAYEYLLDLPKPCGLNEVLISEATTSVGSKFPSAAPTLIPTVARSVPQTGATLLPTVVTSISPTGAF